MMYALPVISGTTAGKFPTRVSATSSPVPNVVARRGSRSAFGTSGRPEASALSITAVDPVKMELLFERFLSEARGEWADIDLDLPSGDAREKVIQHVYATYGVHGAAMTANCITYRDRPAARETAKALGFSTEQVDALAKRLATWSFGEYRDAAGPLTASGAYNYGSGTRHEAKSAKFCCIAA